MRNRSRSHIEAETVVSELDVGKSQAHQPLVRFTMRQIVGDVGEPGPAGPEPRHELKRLLHGLMHGVRLVAEGDEQR